MKTIFLLRVPRKYWKQTDVGRNYVLPPVLMPLLDLGISGKIEGNTPLHIVTE